MLDPGTIYFVIWIAVILCAVLSMNLLDSRTGRAIRALRRGHVAAEAFGVQTPRAKLLVFIYAAVLAGLSGWLYAHFQRAANPTPFGPQAGIEYLFIAVVGGAGYVWGAVLGAAIVVVLKEILQSYLPLVFGGQGQLEIIVFGIMLVVLLQLAPTGVWPWLMSLLPFESAASGRIHRLRRSRISGRIWNPARCCKSTMRENSSAASSPSTMSRSTCRPARSSR